MMVLCVDFDRVNSMLQQRSQHAKAVSEVYTFCVQFLQIHNKPDIFQVRLILFVVTDKLFSKLESYKTNSVFCFAHDCN